MASPVAPRLTHRAGLDVAEGGVAVGVDDQAVGQAVGVLVEKGRCNPAMAESSSPKTARLART